jgi:Flp pilus assembly protein TadG
MRSRLGKFIARLQDDTGAAAVEFALIMTPLIAILLLCLQAFIVFWLDSEIQSLAQKAARQVMTGAVQDASMNQGAFLQMVENLAPPPFQPASVMVDVKSASSYSTLDTTAPVLTYNGAGQVSNVWSYSPGAAGDIVIVRVMYAWPIYGGPLAVGLANQGANTRLLIGTAVFKNEPYQ